MARRASLGCRGARGPRGEAPCEETCHRARGRVSWARWPRCGGACRAGGLCSTCPCVAWLQWDVFFCREGCFAPERKEVPWIRRAGGRPCGLLLSQALPRRSSYVGARGRAATGDGCARGCRWKGASPLAGGLCPGRQTPAGNIPHGTESRPPSPAGAAAAFPASGQDSAPLCAPVLSLSAGWSTHTAHLSPAGGT